MVSFADPLSADSEALFGLSVTPDKSTICFMPTATCEFHNELPSIDPQERNGWDTQWRVSLSADAPPPIFEGQWSDEHYCDPDNGAVHAGIPQAWINDFYNILFHEGNPLGDMERCGREPGTPHSRCGIQIVLCDTDALQLNFSSFPFPRGREVTPFAVKLYGAEWTCPWDDEPGLHRRSLPNHWVLRRKTSPKELNKIRLTVPESRVFAIATQGPGINSDDISQYGSLICLYYVPKPGQALSQIDRERSLLKKALPVKLQTLPFIYGAIYPQGLNALLTALKLPPKRRELHATFASTWGIHFSENPIRRSWLYHCILGHPFLEAVYVHSYNRFFLSGSRLLANLIWDERAKGEALQQKCSECFNVDALPKELRDFLFDHNAPFSKLRFQVNVQYYMPGERLVKQRGPDGKEQETLVPDLIQCLRPHYAVANMPFPGGNPKDLVCGLFAMKLYGAEFTDKRNEGGISHFPHGLPSGFLLKTVHTHEGTTDVYGTIYHHWLASPNNCQIAGTDNHNISQSFYSVVMGKCMQFCDAYDNNRPWDENEVTAIVTLHILSSEEMWYPLLREDSRDNDVVKESDVVRLMCRPFTSGEELFPIDREESLSSVAQKLYMTYTIAHGRESKNPFEELCTLLPVELIPDIDDW
jgi:hypothetical protein